MPFFALHQPQAGHKHGQPTSNRAGKTCTRVSEYKSLQRAAQGASAEAGSSGLVYKLAGKYSDAPPAAQAGQGRAAVRKLQSRSGRRAAWKACWSHKSSRCGLRCTWLEPGWPLAARPALGCQLPGGPLRSGQSTLERKRLGRQSLAAPAGCCWSTGVHRTANSGRLPVGSGLQNTWQGVTRPEKSWVRELKCPVQGGYLRHGHHVNLVSVCQQAASCTCRMRRSSSTPS